MHGLTCVLNFRPETMLNNISLKQCCQLRSSVPRALSNFNSALLLQLKELDVSSNALEGSLPEIWSNLTSVSRGIAFIC